MLTRPGAAAIVQAIIDLADALGMETTAEGVEEQSQLAILTKQGATSIQGFLFSGPSPPPKRRGCSSPGLSFAPPEPFAHGSLRSVIFPPQTAMHR